MLYFPKYGFDLSLVLFISAHHLTCICADRGRLVTSPVTQPRSRRKTFSFILFRILLHCNVKYLLSEAWCDTHLLYHLLYRYQRRSDQSWDRKPNFKNDLSGRVWELEMYNYFMCDTMVIIILLLSWCSAVQLVTDCHGLLNVVYNYIKSSCVSNIIINWFLQFKSK